MDDPSIKNPPAIGRGSEDQHVFVLAEWSRSGQAGGLEPAAQPAGAAEGGGGAKNRQGAGDVLAEGVLVIVNIAATDNCARVGGIENVKLI
jgi:hypothetical protein